MLQGTTTSRHACAVPHCVSIRTASVMLRAANNCAANPLVPAKLSHRTTSAVGLRNLARKVVGCKMLWTSGLQQRCSASLQTPLSRPCGHRPAVFQRAQPLLASRQQVYLHLNLSSTCPPLRHGQPDRSDRTMRCAAVGRCHLL